MVGAAVKAGPGPEALEGAGTIKPKGLSQRFEGEEGDRQIRCLQHNPEKAKHRCSPENRRSNGELQVVQGSEEQVGG